MEEFVLLLLWTWTEMESSTMNIDTSSSAEFDTDLPFLRQGVDHKIANVFAVE